MNVKPSLTQVTLLVFLLLPLTSSREGTQNNFFPFLELGSNGVTYSYLSSERDGYASHIYPEINTGARRHSYAYISQHGAITFHDMSSKYPYGSSQDNFYLQYIIAPFWNHNYMTLDGYVRYEVHNQYQTYELSMNLKNRVQTYINDVLGSVAYPGSIQSLLIVDWNGMVRYIGSKETNRFQVIIASSQSESYALFTYQCGGLQWSTSSALIGFNAGTLFRNHPLSKSSESPNPIACVNSPNSLWSNVVYRISNFANVCSFNEFGCTNGLCVPNYDQCDGKRDCSDGSDEIGCYPRSIPSCYTSQFGCASGGCVSMSDKCDGIKQCADGSDETGCSDSSGISTGGITGIVTSSFVIVLLFVIIIVTILVYQLKQRNFRRSQFQHLRNQLSVRPPPTPHASTLYFHPKPGEWYQTIEGQWVQGPPPAYEGNSPDDLQDNNEVELIGGFDESNETEVLLEPSRSDVTTSFTSSPLNVESLVSVSGTNLPTGSDTPLTNEVGVDNEEGSSIEAGVGMVNEEGDSLEASPSASSMDDNENVPLIETP